MKTILIGLIQALLAVLDEEMVKGFMDKGLDFLEDKIAASATKWDDALVLPLINHTRKVLDIPDNDPELTGPPPA